MEQNIVMKITHECNPNEARFRAGDFLIGNETILNTVIYQKTFPKMYIFPNKYYTIEKSTFDELKDSNNVKYHYVSSKTPQNVTFTFETLSKENALKKLSNKNRIPIKFNDKRTLKELIDEKEQNHFLYDMAQHESECVLNEEWLTWNNTNWKSHQIEYYKNLKTDAERKIYADASGQQYALNLLFSPIHKSIDTYGLEHFNTFFENVEFYYDNINQDENQDDNEYLTSLNIKEL